MSFSKEVSALITDAAKVAKRFGQVDIAPEHLLSVMIINDEIMECLAYMKADYAELIANLTEHLISRRVEVDNAQQPMPDGLCARIIEAAVAAVDEGEEATVFDVFWEFLKLPFDECAATAMLHESGATSSLMESYVRKLQQEYEEATRRIYYFGPGSFTSSVDFSGYTLSGNAVGPAPTKDESTDQDKAIAEATKTLDKLAINLNEKAKTSAIDPLVGREKEVDEVIRILQRRRKNNPLLIGEPGVGKTAIAEGFARRIVEGNVPEMFIGQTIYNLDIGSLIAGTKFRGEFEDRLDQLIKAVQTRGDVILFIDEIHQIVGAGRTGDSAVDAANILKPALARGTLRCIGATTYDDYTKNFERDRALIRRFKQIAVNPPSRDEAKAILMGLRSHYETHHGVSYSVEAIEAAVDLTERYIRSATLPDKAIDVIDEAGARAALERRKTPISAEDIEQEVATIARIPLSTIREDEGLRIVSMGDRISQNVFGQKAAVKAVSDAIKLSRVGLRDVDKTASSFIFSGPTGVGKTEVSKALAAELSIPLVRFDMSEYMERHSIARLIGAQPGYVGYGDGGAASGLLISEIEKNPHCVLLLDEVEKAHPDIFNVLLQIMDGARLTSGSGKTVDFRNVILIMTTNAGAAKKAKAAIGFTGSNAKADEAALKKFFAPEFLNRVDKIIAFDPLGQDDVRNIVTKFIGRLSDMLTSREIGVVLHPCAADWLATKGFDAEFGARPLARLIDEHIKLPIADMILLDRLPAGAKVVLKARNEVIEISSEMPTLLALEPC